MGESEYKPEIKQRYSDSYLSDIEKEFIQKNEKKIKFIRELNDEIYRRSMLQLKGKDIPVNPEKLYILSLSLWLNNYFFPGYEFLGAYKSGKLSFLGKMSFSRGESTLGDGFQFFFKDKDFQRLNMLFSLSSQIKEGTLTLDYNDEQVRTSVPRQSTLQEHSIDRLSVLYSTPFRQNYLIKGELRLGRNAYKRPFSTLSTEKQIYFLKANASLKRQLEDFGGYFLYAEYFNNFQKHYLVFGGEMQFKQAVFKDFVFNAGLKTTESERLYSLNPYFRATYASGIYSFSAVLRSTKKFISPLTLNNYFVDDYSVIAANESIFAGAINGKLNFGRKLSLEGGVNYNNYHKYSYLSETGEHLLAFSSVDDFQSAFFKGKIHYKIRRNLSVSGGVERVLYTTKYVPYKAYFNALVNMDFQFLKRFSSGFQANYFAKRYADISGSTKLKPLIHYSLHISYKFLETLQAELALGYNALNRQIYNNYEYPLFTGKMGVKYKF